MQVGEAQRQDQRRTQQQQQLSIYAQPAEEVLPLYGRGDHAAAPDPLTVTEAFALLRRAVYLLTIFAPFFYLGVPLLLLAMLCFSRQQQSRLGLRARKAAWRLLLSGCRASGPAFIK
jgi:hypothetical protein